MVSPTLTTVSLSDPLVAITHIIHTVFAQSGPSSKWGRGPFATIVISNPSCKLHEHRFRWVLSWVLGWVFIWRFFSWVLDLK
jgi:hypothetical protein